MKRTDPHRPGAIIPADYEAVFCFNMSSMCDGWPVPSYRVNCLLDRRQHERDERGNITKTIEGEHDADGNCCVIGLRQIRKEHFALDGGPGQCTVCRAHYIYGEAWRHKPTGDIVFLGHDCAEKYEMLMDHTEAELAAERARAGVLKGIQRQRNDAERSAFLEKHPGLAELLARDHHILADLSLKLTQYRSLSEAQIALAKKIVHELDNPQAAEINVPAPTGKTTFRGVVVSRRKQEGSFGETMKITVKVTTPEGVWLAWGTQPAALVDWKHDGELKGAEVELTATLKAGRDPHFAIMNRPRGKVVKRTCSSGCKACERERMGDEAFELKEMIEHCRLEELVARQRGLFTKAVWYQSQADEAERLGRLPAADDSLWSSGYLWARTLEDDSAEKRAY